jgi:hypothetical protein
MCETTSTARIPVCMFVLRLAGPHMAQPAGVGALARCRPAQLTWCDGCCCCCCPSRPPQLIPEDFEYDSSGDPAFVSGDQSMRIREGMEVRVRIVGVRVDAAEIVSGRGVSKLWRRHKRAARFCLRCMGHAPMACSLGTAHKP